MSVQHQRLDLIIRNVRDGIALGTVDIGFAEGRIATVETTIPQSADQELVGEGRVASPAFIQPHIHLDKVDVGDMLPSNRSGTLAEAIELLHDIKRRATVEEIAERAGRVIRQGVQTGTTMFRTHVDVDTVGGMIPLQGVMKAREDLRDLCQIPLEEHLPNATLVVDHSMRYGWATRPSTMSRRRVQNETLGHRGRKTDPLYRVRRVLLTGDERLSEDRFQWMRAMLEAGDPDGAVSTKRPRKGCSCQRRSELPPGSRTG